MKSLALHPVGRQRKPFPAVCREETKVPPTGRPAIRYTLVSCPRGRLLLASTDLGVCAVCIGGDDAALERELAGEYPAAELRRDDAGRRPWADELLSHLDGRLSLPNLPTDVRATTFQRRVWQELLAIPYGDTRSYSEIARRLDRPTAARACATNPVTVLVPCHRVVREGGGLGGYRWGLDRKKALLETERTAAVALTARGGRPEGGSGG